MDFKKMIHSSMVLGMMISCGSALGIDPNGKQQYQGYTDKINAYFAEFEKIEKKTKNKITKFKEAKATKNKFHEDDSNIGEGDIRKGIGGIFGLTSIGSLMLWYLSKPSIMSRLKLESIHPIITTSKSPSRWFRTPALVAAVVLGIASLYSLLSIPYYMVKARIQKNKANEEYQTALHNEMFTSEEKLRFPYKECNTLLNTFIQKLNTDYPFNNPDCGLLQESDKEDIVTFKKDISEKDSNEIEKIAKRIEKFTSNPICGNLYKQVFKLKQKSGYKDFFGPSSHLKQCQTDIKNNYLLRKENVKCYLREESFSIRDNFKESNWIEEKKQS
jgi:hypothetical protein